MVYRSVQIDGDTPPDKTPFQEKPEKAKETNTAAESVITIKPTERCMDKNLMTVLLKSRGSRQDDISDQIAILTAIDFFEFFNQKLVEKNWISKNPLDALIDELKKHEKTNSNKKISFEYSGYLGIEKKNGLVCRINTGKSDKKERITFTPNSCLVGKETHFYFDIKGAGIDRAFSHGLNNDKNIANKCKEEILIENSQSSQSSQSVQSK